MALINVDPNNQKTISSVLALSDSASYSLYNTSKVYMKDGMLIQDPLTIFDLFPDYFDDKIKMIPLLQQYHYKPEYLSKDLYGSVDLWFLLLKINKCISHENFNMANVYVIDPNKLTEMKSFMQVLRDDLEKNKRNPPSIDDLTLIPVNL